MEMQPRSGTRGRAKRKSNLIERCGQKFMTSRARKKGTVMGMNVLILMTMGRKSGLPRKTTVAWFPDRDNSWVIVASYLGSRSDPDWFYNLSANPEVSIELSGQGTIPVRAEQLEGAEREEVWKRLVGLQPRYDKYQAKTDRLLPVVRLTRLSV